MAAFGFSDVFDFLGKIIWVEFVHVKCYEVWKLSLVYHHCNFFIESVNLSSNVILAYIWLFYTHIQSLKYIVCSIWDTLKCNLKQCLHSNVDSVHILYVSLSYGDISKMFDIYDTHDKFQISLY